MSIKNLSAADIAIVIRLAKALNYMAAKDAAYEEGRCTQEVRDNAETKLIKAQTAFDALEGRVEPSEVLFIYRTYR